MFVIASVVGIGWVSPESIGRGREHMRLRGSDHKLPELTSRMLFGKASVHFGRLDCYSKLGFTAITYALRDAGLENWTEKRSIGIIASTVYGCLGADVDYYKTVHSPEGSFPSPNLFAYTLPNVYLGEAATRFGLTGQAFVINEPVLSGMSAVRMAIMSIGSGGCSAMLAGVCDEGRPEPIECDVQTNPGALFMVLQSPANAHDFSYGNIGMEPNGSVFFKNTEIFDLWSMKDLCRVSGSMTKIEGTKY